MGIELVPARLGGRSVYYYRGEGLIHLFFPVFKW